MKIISPASVIIEKTALEMAAVFFEIGRGQGMTSKFKTARHYSAANMEKFIPNAVAHLRQMWLDPNTPENQRALLHDVFLERINDTDATNLAKSAEGRLPDIDISKIMPVQDQPAVIMAQKRFVEGKL